MLVVGTDALAAEVRAVGLTPVSSAEDKPAAVVQGYGPNVGWPELAVTVICPARRSADARLVSSRSTGENSAPTSAAFGHRVANS